MTKTVIGHIFHSIAACALVCSGVKGHQEHSTVTQGIAKMRGAVFRMKTNCLKEKKRWGEDILRNLLLHPTNLHTHRLLRIPRESPACWFYPVAVGKLGWESHKALWVSLAGQWAARLGCAWLGHLHSHVQGMRSWTVLSPAGHHISPLRSSSTAPSPVLLHPLLHNQLYWVWIVWFSKYNIRVEAFLPLLPRQMQSLL